MTKGGVANDQAVAPISNRAQLRAHPRSIVLEAPCDILLKVKGSGVHAWAHMRKKPAAGTHEFVLARV